MFYYRAGYTEKRNHYRMELNCPIEFKQPGDEEFTCGTCINLSAKGVLVQTDRNFEPGTRLNIQVKPELSLSAPLEAIIRVLRVDAIPESSEYKLAAVIEDLL